jgi:hypothetical protein
MPRFSSFFIIYNPFHIEINKLKSLHMDFWTNHMFKDIYKWPKTLRIIIDYNLIINKIVGISINVRCELFKMSKANHITMLLPLDEIL